MKRHLLLLCAPAAMGFAAPMPMPPVPTAPAPTASMPTGDAQPVAEDDVVSYLPDRGERMTVPVAISGYGPFRFLVDTGAERTVISTELARRLRLGTGGRATLHSMTEATEISTVLIPALTVSSKTVTDIRAPALAEGNLGAEGILGIDTLKQHRVLFDFAQQTMTITPSREVRGEHWSPDTIVVTARNRFGHLVLVDASVDGQKVYVIIDTGSQVSVGNLALRRKLEKRRRLKDPKPIELISVTGGTMQADYTIVKTMKLGGIDINNMPLAFAEVHPFRALKLTDKPAILLGMDALKLFDRVSVDFATRKVRLLPPDISSLPREVRTAEREPRPAAGIGG